MFSRPISFTVKVCALLVLPVLIAAGVLLSGPITATGPGNSITSPDTADDVGEWTSLALDGAGNPVISYYDKTNGDLKIMHCNDVNCSGGDETTNSPDQEDGNGDTTPDNVGEHTSLVLDTSGYPVISYYDVTNRDLKLMHCNDVDCDPSVNGAESIQVVDATNIVGQYSSLVLDPATGYPVISYYDGTNEDLKLAHCNDANCDPAVNGTESVEAVDTDGQVGQWTSLVLDASANPVVSYIRRDGVFDLKLVHCNDPDCSGGDESFQLVDAASGVNTATSLELASGDPVIAYRNTTNGHLKVALCNDPDCDPTVGGAESFQTLDTQFLSGSYISLELDNSDIPVMSYWQNNDGLKVAHCGNTTCTASVFTHLEVGSSIGTHTSLKLDDAGFPVVSYYNGGVGGSARDLKVLHCANPDCTLKPTPTPTPTITPTPTVTPTPTATLPPGLDDKMTSRGKFQILVSPDFRGLMDGYPGYDGISKLDSPDLFDPNTVVGRSLYHLDGDATDSSGASVGSAGTIVSDSDFSLVPGGFEGPAGSREVHTEIRSMNLTAGAVAVRAGTNAPGQPISPGEVESQSASGNLVDDFPADSFFNVFVEVDLPAVFDFPGGTLYNSDPLLVINNDVTSLPPRVVYVHGNSSAVPVYFKSDNLPEWQAGDLFGWLVLAGHGAGFDDSPADIAEFEQIYEDVVEIDPLPMPDSDSGGAPDDLEIFESGDTGNPADDAAILALDSDLDGCTNAQEMGPDETQGGQRDYLNPWDWYDVAGLSGPTPDGYIDLLFDILGVIQHYSPTGAPPYDVTFDRGPTTGPNPWNMTAPDGVIDLLNDILGVIQQYSHDCR